MNLEITLRHIEHTPSIDEKIKQKMGRIERRHLGEDAHVHWTSWQEKDEFVTTLLIKDKGQEYFAKTKDGNFYKTLDLAVENIENQFAHR
jgi:putative sigma-54 modulation protein